MWHAGPVQITIAEVEGFGASRLLNELASHFKIGSIGALPLRGEHQDSSGAALPFISTSEHRLFPGHSSVGFITFLLQHRHAASKTRISEGHDE